PLEELTRKGNEPNIKSNGKGYVQMVDANALAKDALDYFNPFGTNIDDWVDIERKKMLKELRKQYSTILAKDPLPNVKHPFNIVSKEEFHKCMHPGVSCGNNVSFVVKTNNNANNFYRKVNNNNNNNNNSNRGLNPNLLCKNCGLIGHGVERCYELIGYLVGFKKNSNLSKQSIVDKMFNNNADVNNSILLLCESGGLNLFDVDRYGPYRVISKEGYKYFLTIVNDYNRPIWVHLLKSKLESKFFKLHDINTQGSKRHNDEERDTSNMKGNRTTTSDACNFIVDDEAEPMATQIGDSVTSEENVQNTFSGEGSNSMGRNHMLS
nr:hypothetical protein [Tanacetum cinerariifolium]